MQAGDKSEQIKGLYLTQITEDGDLAVLSGVTSFPYQTRLSVAVSKFRNEI